MKLYDISMPISESIITYKNNPAGKPVIRTVASHEESSHHSTDVMLNLHTGSHIDAPLHMIKEGATMETYDLERFITRAKVFDLTKVVGMIHTEDLMGKDIQKGDFIILKTRNSSEDFFNMAFISLAEDGAKYLADIGINGVGIDNLGIERDQSNHMTHISLMNAGVIILEGLRLAEVPEGLYDLIALPVNILGVEASFTRPVLIEK